MYAYIYILKFPTKFVEHLHIENMWYVLVGALKLQLGIPGIWRAGVTKEDGPAFQQLDSLLRKVLLFLVEPGMSVQHLAQHLALLRRMDSISLWRAPLFLGREEGSAGPSMVSLFRVWQCVL